MAYEKYKYRTPLAVRLWRRVDKSAGESACWPWTGCRWRGYGKIGAPGGGRRPALQAHRVAWELTHGPIPDGMYVLHKCDNPPCCNPLHLFLGTHHDNISDMDSKGRRRWGTSHGEAHGRCLLSFEQCVEARALRDAKRLTYKQIAARFGCSVSNIHLVINGPHWSLASSN